LTSPDHQALRRGLIYKSQIQSIGLSFEAIRINGIRDLYYFILWNEILLLNPDHDTEEGSRRFSRGRGRVSSDIDLRDVRTRQHSNTRNISNSCRGIEQNLILYISFSK
jgi:hypothetical protein